ncbi:MULTISPECIES: DUF1405 domain-containing protein [unclassified Exiguobacterium]|uniref:DUF1405 domain-containing protein n=1 Tax=unclassified Exiguobacterium TaxID=2644629 RepID=UPI00044822D7|nr:MULTISPECIES: DUF1405 domain-containing protein [unclassified Exiguobacterium]EZP60917.1 putative membrane protein [Exiguobacterium sp. RIT341]
MQGIFTLLRHKAVLWIVGLINLAGTLYGYYWYEPQLATSKWYFYPFIPDSPTASLFFTIIVFLWIFGRRSRLFEALAFVTLIKYGVWAVVMNALMLNELGTSNAYLTTMALMLMVSHGAMAFQALLFSPLMTFRIKELVLVAIWVVHNDVVDYVLGQWPRYPALAEHIKWIGYGSFWLTGLCLLMGYLFVARDSIDNKVA